MEMKIKMEVRIEVETKIKVEIKMKMEMVVEAGCQLVPGTLTAAWGLLLSSVHTGPTAMKGPSTGPREDHSRVCRDPLHRDGGDENGRMEMGWKVGGSWAAAAPGGTGTQDTAKPSGSKRHRAEPCWVLTGSPGAPGVPGKPGGP